MTDQQPPLDGTPLHRIEVLVTQLQAEMKGFGSQLGNVEQSVRLRIETGDREVSQALELLKENFQGSLGMTNLAVTQLAETVKEIEIEHEKDRAAHDVRITALERWQWRAAGIALGAGLASGGVVGIVLKAIGG